MLGAGFSVPEIFLAIALLNAAVGAYLFLLVPEYLLRFVAFLLSRLMHRFKVEGGDNIPAAGAAIIVCNPVSAVDALLLMAASPRPMRLLIDRRFFALPLLGWLFRLAKAIPAPHAEDPASYAAALDAADQVLADGGLLCVFVDGGSARQPIFADVMKIPGRRVVLVVPVALRHLQDSTLSRIEAGAARQRRLFSRVKLVAGPALAPAELTAELTAERLQAEVQALLTR
jgi:1-acyl-sn-glycerol-3-phosphate acyltransferase